MSNAKIFSNIDKKAWVLLPMIVFLLMLMYVGQVSASVVMTGTRVIYPAAQKERTLQFANQASTPYVVQLWVDEKAQNSSREEAKSPFVVTPPVFRINAGEGQVARLMMVDPASVPQDKESVYYLSFSQIPGVKQGEMEMNQLLIMVVNRLKVFYRPSGLEPVPNNIGNSLEYGWEGKGLKIHNPTPYHASVSNVEVTVNGKSYPFSNIDMVAPFSTVVWEAPSDLPRNAGKKSIKIGVVNDFGTVVRSEHVLP